MGQEIQLHMPGVAPGVVLTPDHRREMDKKLKDLKEFFGDSVTLETTETRPGEPGGMVKVTIQTGKPPVEDARGGGSGGSGGEGQGQGGQRGKTGGSEIIDIAFLEAWNTATTTDVIARAAKEMVLTSARNQQTDAAEALKKMTEAMNLKPIMKVLEVLVKVLAIVVSVVVLAASIAAAVASGGAAAPLIAAVIAGIGMLMSVVSATPAVDAMEKSAPGMKIAWDVMTIAVSVAALGVGVVAAAAKTAAQTAAQTAAKVTEEATKKALETTQKVVTETVKQTSTEVTKEVVKQSTQEAAKEATKEALSAANRELAESMGRRLTLVGKGVGAVTGLAGASSASVSAYAGVRESEGTGLQARANLANRDQDFSLKLAEHTMETMKAVTDSALAIMESYSQVLQSMHSSRALSQSV